MFINSDALSMAGKTASIRVNKLEVTFVSATDAQPAVKVEGVDTEFKAEIDADNITATGEAMPLRDGLRIEVSPHYNGKYGAVRYTDGSLIPNEVVQFTITGDSSLNAPAKLAIVFGPEVAWIDEVTHKPEPATP